jgi:hypothetical protein
MTGGFLPAMMRICQRVFACALLNLLALPPLQAAEFYSWIDSSGSVVLTDDLSELPPSLPKTSIWVHRFLERPAAPAADRAPGGAEPPPSTLADNPSSPARVETSSPAPGPVIDHLQRGNPASESLSAEAPTGQLALGQTLVLGVPLAPVLRSGHQPLPMGVLGRIPPGPDGLAQRLRELQALQARAASFGVPSAPSGKSRHASTGQGRAAR